MGAAGRTGYRWAWCLITLVAVVRLACGSSHKLPGSRAHARPPNRDINRPIALSALHGRIVISRRDDIWSANADGSRLRRLTSKWGPEFDPRWSPDGSRIAYRDSRRGINLNDEIYVMDADGSHRRNLTHTGSNEWSPAWSPDGRLIAFYSGQLFVMRPDGTRRHALTEVEGEYPAWAPDGRRLAFMSAQPDAHGSNPNYDVFVVDPGGAHLRQLTDWPGEDGWPAWSPDGRWIAFTTTHDVKSGRYDASKISITSSGLFMPALQIAPRQQRAVEYRHLRTEPWGERSPPMGRNPGRQWGDSMAAYGEVSMAAVRRIHSSAAEPLGRDPDDSFVARFPTFGHSRATSRQRRLGFKFGPSRSQLSIGRVGSGCSLANA